MLTYAGLLKELEDWARQSLDADLGMSAINDAVESLFSTVAQARIEEFVGAPVSVQFAAGTERKSLVSITDPAGAPTLQQVLGGTFGGRTNLSAYFTLVTESGSETLPSPAGTIANVNGGNVGKVLSPARVDGAVGWNCYAGYNIADSTQAVRRNDEPLGFGEDLTEDIAQGWDGEGAPEDGAYPPLVNTTADDITYIQRMEVLQSDGKTYVPWSQADITSVLWSRVSGQIASTSSGESYVYDLLSGNTVEIRPMLGTTINARYFYVKKPRRVLFTDFNLPFTNISEAVPFLRHYALGRIFSSSFGDKRGPANLLAAEQTRRNIINLLGRKNANKNKRVTPLFR